MLSEKEANRLRSWWNEEPVREGGLGKGQQSWNSHQDDRRIKRCMVEERAARDRPANPHIYIPLINPDYHFLIGLLRLPWNKVTLPNELNRQFTIPFTGSFYFGLPCRFCVAASRLSVACGLTPHKLTAKCLGHTCAPFMGSGKSNGLVLWRDWSVQSSCC